MLIHNIGLLAEITKIAKMTQPKKPVKLWTKYILDRLTKAKISVKSDWQQRNNKDSEDYWENFEVDLGYGTRARELYLDFGIVFRPSNFNNASKLEELLEEQIVIGSKDKITLLFNLRQDKARLDLIDINNETEFLSLYFLSKYQEGVEYDARSVVDDVLRIFLKYHYGEMSER